MSEPLSTPAVQGTVAGWKPAPFDATSDMIAAALSVDWSNESEEAVAHNVWHAMLSASPSPEALPASGWTAEAMAEVIYGSAPAPSGLLKKLENAAELLAMNDAFGGVQLVIAEAIAALSPAPSGSGVRVKPLRWVYQGKVPAEAWGDNVLRQFIGHHDLGRYAGSYCVQEREPGGSWGWWCTWTSNREPEGIKPTEDAAKAACQADFERRILSVIASDASPRGEAVSSIHESCGDRSRSAQHAGDAPVMDQAEVGQLGESAASHPDHRSHPAPATVEIIEALKARLGSYAITEEYDFPGDAAEFCGYWCHECREHVEADGTGHGKDCPCHGVAPNTPRAVKERAALAPATEGSV